MARYIVIVAIEADSPLSAELIIGRALHLHAPNRASYVHQTSIKAAE